jgi:plastocyanin
MSMRHSTAPNHTLPSTAPSTGRVSRRRWGVVLVGVALAISLTACSSGSSPGASATTTPSSGAVSTDAITIQNFAFHPSTITVKPGASVSVTNKDSVTHTLTSTSGAFTTGNLPGGQTMHITVPTKPGTYTYRCSIHQYMTGTIVVS